MLPCPAFLAAALPADRREGLLRHLDALFAFAQVVAADAERATELVAETYRRALATAPEERETPDEKVWLFRLLVETHREAQLEDGLSPAEVEAPDALRQGLVDQLLRHRLPSAFASLPREDRQLLLLCEVERLACGDAADVLGMEPEDACRRLDGARQALRTTLLGEASPTERRLLEELPSDWRRRALGHLAQTVFDAPPETLQPEILALADEAEETFGRGRAPAPPLRRRPGARPEARAEASSALARRLRRFFLGVLLVAAAGMLGYVASTLLREEPETNLILLSARQAHDLRPTFETGSAEQAERFIRDRLGLRLTVPDIEDAPLAGVSITEISPGVEVPALLYEDLSDAGPITLYSFSYALLDRYKDRIYLDRETLDQIEDASNFELHDFGDARVLVWRNRDDIYVAVTQGDAERLRGRIAFPS